MCTRLCLSVLVLMVCCYASCMLSPVRVSREAFVVETCTLDATKEGPYFFGVSPPLGLCSCVLLEHTHRRVGRLRGHSSLLRLQPRPVWGCFVSSTTSSPQAWARILYDSLRHLVLPESSHARTSFFFCRVRVSRLCRRPSVRDCGVMSDGWWRG